jgi:hypothetical protein
MSKEILLTSPAEIALGLETRAPRTVEGLAPISIKTTFGRAVVVQRITEGEATAWAAGLQHEANDHRYYETDPRHAGPAVRALLSSAEGPGRSATRTIQPFLIVKQDLATGLPGRRAPGPGQTAPSFPFHPRHAHAHGRLFRRRGPPRHATAPPARSNGCPGPARSAAPRGRRLKARMIVLQGFPQVYRTPLRHAAQGRLCPGAEHARLPARARFQGFRGISQTKLSHKTRKNLRQKYRKAAASANLTLEMSSPTSRPTSTSSFRSTSRCSSAPATSSRN